MKGLAAILSGFLLLVIACRSAQKEPAHALPLTGSAEVSGFAQAKDGTALPGVTVTLVAADGASRTLVTDGQGNYHFTSVPAGSYMLHFELAGFGKATRGVRVAPTGRFNIVGTLNPAATESITVTAEAPLLSMQKSVAGYVVAPSPIPQEVPVAVADQYSPIAEHTFIEAKKEATTTFAIDVDRASYANVRRMLSNNQLPPPDAVRLEEMVNYFAYSYPQPSAADPFSITAEVAGCPWDPTHRLMRIGIQGRNLDEWKMAPNNLVFLLDVSGSMSPPDRLPLIQSAFRLLVDKLRAEDTVSIVVYAGNAGLVLPPTSGADKATILAALGRLSAGGSTAGGAGIELAYKVAKDNFKANGNNRVHSMNEAKKVFERELTGTLVTIAKDVKVQIEFDRSRVASYRQLGYEDRALANKDFEDDTKDAGELGAGHSVTALYEIAPVGSASAGPIASVKLRYKDPHGETSKLVAASATDTGTSAYAASADMQFAAAVAEFAMLLRKSPHKGTASYADVAALARASRGVDLDGTREEMLRLVETSRALSGEGGTIARK